LHNSVLLNRVTPSKDWIYITITCYIELENFVQPACITKDLSLIFYARDTRVTLPRSLRSLIVGDTYKSKDANKVSAVYKMAIRQAIDSASPGASRRLGRVIDTSTSYVRGEEMLKGWRPRSDSLIFEHQWELEKLTRLQQVEKTKNFLLLRSNIEIEEKEYNINKTMVKEKTSESLKSNNSNTNRDLNKQISTEDNDDTHSQTSSSTSTSTSTSSSSYTDNQKQLLLNCIKLINQGRYIPLSEKVSPATSISRSIYDFTNLKTIANTVAVNNSSKQIIPNINVCFNNFYEY
jgi:kinesin family protein 1